MFELIHAYGWIFLLALLIGTATGWWAWAHRRVSVSGGVSSGLGSVTAAVGDAANAAKSTVKDAAETITGAVGAAAAGITEGGKPKIKAAVGAPDDLLLLKGIGPKLNALCHSLGVSRFDQISKWNESDVAEVDQYLGTFRGRIVRDSWIEQAGYLASGNIAAFEAKFGKLDSENK